MTTLELTQTQVAESALHEKARQYSVVKAARDMGSWLVDRMTGSRNPVGRVTTVSTFNSDQSNDEDYRDWFYHNEYEFGD